MSAAQPLGGLAARIRRYFWLWVAYQTVKGAVTTFFIWVPLLYAFVAD